MAEVLRPIGFDPAPPTRNSRHAARVRWISNTGGTELELPPEVAQELRDSFEGIDAANAFGTFKAVCEEIDAQSLYALYGNLSQFVHPTTTISNIHLHFDGAPSITPSSGLTSNISLVAHCLIWAEGSFLQLAPDETRADLERLAKSIRARTALPTYRPAKPRATTNRDGDRKRTGGHRCAAFCS